MVQKSVHALWATLALSLAQPPVAAAAPAAREDSLVVAVGTPVYLRLSATVSARGFRPGDLIPCEVLSPFVWAAVL